MLEKELPVKCRKCKKAPKNCDCAEYVLTGEDGRVMVVVDNIATEPVRGQQSRTWQPRANARVWRSPTYVDGFPVLYLTDPKLVARVDAEINDGTFNPFNYKEVPGARVPDFHKDILRRFAILRRAKQAIAKSTKLAA